MGPRLLGVMKGQGGVAMERGLPLSFGNCSLENFELVWALRCLRGEMQELGNGGPSSGWWGWEGSLGTSILGVGVKAGAWGRDPEPFLRLAESR